MKLIRNKTWIYSILILTISFFGCEDDDEAGGTLPTLVAGFTQTVQEGTGVVTFINISENADSFAWDFGDGTTSDTNVASDRKSTRLNSSHLVISYAVFCLKKKSKE